MPTVTNYGFNPKEGFGSPRRMDHMLDAMNYVVGSVDREVSPASMGSGANQPAMLSGDLVSIQGVPVVSVGESADETVAPDNKGRWRAINRALRSGRPRFNIFEPTSRQRVETRNCSECDKPELKAVLDSLEGMCPQCFIKKKLKEKEEKAKDVPPPTGRKIRA